LLLASTLPDVADAQHSRTRWLRAGSLELVFLVVLDLATSLTLPVVGALLIFSLMIGPPAAARSLTANPRTALGLSVVIALVTVWLSIAGAYRSNLPVGFFVGVISAACYTFGRLYARWRGSRTRAVRAAVAGAPR
jgi:zinc/manganese transport system permease protein